MTVHQPHAAESQGVRARARAELLADVSRIAKTHLAESGAAALSVRAIARELGMVSSALYRYVPSRDALLTQLIVDSFNALGEAVEHAEATCDRTDVLGRYRATCHGVRDWARAHPHEYALIYGSPVPGYAAPDDTIDPAVRVARVLVAIAEHIDPDRVTLRTASALPGGLRAQLRAMRESLQNSTPDHVLVLGVLMWAQLFGMISFELFGTFHNTFDDATEIFEHHIDLGAVAFGLAR